jgi:hypothetical protein
MKRLTPPNIDDLDILLRMKNNLKIASQPFIRNEYRDLLRKYLTYSSSAGNPWACAGQTISNELKEKLEYHFKKPYSDLIYITELRSKGSPDVCPFCGSLKTGTLDHYLPQANYPELIIYSKNLVPACDCNSKRRNDVKGINNNQRVLHPYYDDCLNNRITRAAFTGDLDIPDIDIVPIPQLNVPQETIQFHINTVVKRTTIVPWMRSKWQSMKKNPRTIISSIPRTPNQITMNELDVFLHESLDDKDNEHGTMNNWYSMFISGIQCSIQAKTWLLNRHNGIINGTIDPFS